MDEALIKKVPPHNIEAEKSVIGSMLLDKDAITTASEIITDEDFYQYQYKILFTAMMELYDDGKPVDLITLQNKLKEKELPPELSNLEFISELIRSVPTSTNVR